MVADIRAFSNNELLTSVISVFMPLTLPFTHLTHYFSGDLGTLLLGIPYYACNATKVARETTVLIIINFFFTKLWCEYLTVGVPVWVLVYGVPDTFYYTVFIKCYFH